MITAANLTIEQIVAAKNATVRATMSGESTAEIKKLSDACAVAMGTWDSDGRTAARQIVADWINAQPVTAETVTDEQIRELRRIITPNNSLAHLWHDCCRALADGGYRNDPRCPEARDRCAAAINARNAAVRK